MPYFCTHCGKERPLAPGYAPIDERYAMVACKVKAPGYDVSLTEGAFDLEPEPSVVVRPGTADRNEALEIRQSRTYERRMRAAKIAALFEVSKLSDLSKDQRQSLRRVL